MNRGGRGDELAQLEEEALVLPRHYNQFPLFLSVFRLPRHCGHRRRLPRGRPRRSARRFPVHRDKVRAESQVLAGAVQGEGFAAPAVPVRVRRRRPVHRRPLPGLRDAGRGR